jgi:hypothetical protein
MIFCRNEDRGGKEHPGRLIRRLKSRFGLETGKGNLNTGSFNALPRCGRGRFAALIGERCAGNDESHEDYG